MCTSPSFLQFWPLLTMLHCKTEGAESGKLSLGLFTTSECPEAEAVSAEFSLTLSVRISCSLSGSGSTAMKSSSLEDCGRSLLGGWLTTASFMVGNPHFQRKHHSAAQLRGLPQMGAAADHHSWWQCFPCWSVSQYGKEPEKSWDPYPHLGTGIFSYQHKMVKRRMLTSFGPHCGVRYGIKEVNNKYCWRFGQMLGRLMGGLEG